MHELNIYTTRLKISTAKFIENAVSMRHLVSIVEVCIVVRRDESNS
jgi:hypothetical protein